MSKTVKPTKLDTILLQRAMQRVFDVGPDAVEHFVKVLEDPTQSDARRDKSAKLILEFMTSMAEFVVPRLHRMHVEQQTSVTFSFEQLEAAWRHAEGLAGRGFRPQLVEGDHDGNGSNGDGSAEAG